MSPRHFHFPFPLNGSLLGSTATRLSRFPGLSESAAPSPPRFLPQTLVPRARSGQTRAQRGPRRVPGPGATPARQ